VLKPEDVLAVGIGGLNPRPRGIVTMFASNMFASNMFATNMFATNMFATSSFATNGCRAASSMRFGA
jgi:hypothetical protein